MTDEKQTLEEQTETMEPVPEFIDLSRGITGDDGVKHKRLIMRPPTMADHMRAGGMANQYAAHQDAEIKQAALSSDFHELCLVSLCTVKLGGIQEITPELLMELSRIDFFTAQNHLVRLEDQDEYLAKKG